MDASSSGEVHTQATCRFPNPCGQRRQNWPATKVLHLEYGKLKRVMEATAILPTSRTAGRPTSPTSKGSASHTGKSRLRTRTAFVELAPLATVSGDECVLELEGSRGKLRLRLRGSAAEDLASLSRALWEVVV